MRILLDSCCAKKNRFCITFAFFRFYYAKRAPVSERKIRLDARRLRGVRQCLAAPVHHHLVGLPQILLAEPDEQGRVRRLGVAENGRQRLLELVGKRCRQFPHRTDAIRMGQLL